MVFFDGLFGWKCVYVRYMCCGGVVLVICSLCSVFSSVWYSVFCLFVLSLLIVFVRNLGYCSVFFVVVWLCVDRCMVSVCLLFSVWCFLMSFFVLSVLIVLFVVVVVSCVLCVILLSCIGFLCCSSSMRILFCVGVRLVFFV